MRLRISTILCLTLFVVTHAAPSRKIESESAKRDDQAPPIEQGQDPYTLMPQDQRPPGNEMLNDCCAPDPTCLNPCQQPPPPPQSFAINFAPPPAPMPPPPPPPPAYTGDCCPPSQTCMNPCPPPQAAQIPPAMPMMQPMPPAMPMAPPVAPPMPPPMLPPMAPPMFGAPMGGPCCDPNVVQQCANPCAPPTSDEGRERRPYQPYPGEITFKLKQAWKDSFLDDNSPASLILKGNVENAIKIALGDDGRSYGYGGYGPVTVSNIYFREGYVPGNPSTMPITVAHVMVNGGSDDASRLQALVTPDSSLGDGLKVYKDSFSAY